MIDNVDDLNFLEFRLRRHTIAYIHTMPNVGVNKNGLQTGIRYVYIPKLFKLGPVPISLNLGCRSSTDTAGARRPDIIRRHWWGEWKENNFVLFILQSLCINSHCVEYTITPNVRRIHAWNNKSYWVKSQFCYFQMAGAEGIVCRR